MAGEGGQDKQKYIILGVIGIIVLYRVGSPFMEETKKKREQLEGVKKEIKRVEQGLAMFAGNWEEKIAKDELKFKQYLPDHIYSGDVIRYFNHDFSKKHKSFKVQSLVPHLPKTSAIKPDSHNKRIALRSSHTRLRAEMSQKDFLPFLLHVDKYPPLFEVKEMKLETGQPGRAQKKLQLNLGMDLYLTPKEWLPSKKRVVTKVEETKKTGIASWFGEEEEEKPDPKLVEAEKKKKLAVKVVKKKRKKKRKPPPPPEIKFKVERMVGDSIIVKGELYEEGDEIQGWKLLRVTPSKKKLLFRKGTYQRELILK